MQEFKAQLQEKIERSRDVVSFRFPNHGRIDFLPGQFLQVIFDQRNPGNKELNKYLSFSSSPTKEYFEVTKKLTQSVFSNRLRSLKQKDEVSFNAPFGNCVFKDEYRKIGFLIGGIGITPVISIIEYIVDRSLATDVLLLYSNKTQEDIAFRRELDAWQESNSNIKVVYTLTDCQSQDDRCLHGVIDKPLLNAKTDDAGDRIFYIFGPPKMVEVMENICLESQCSKQNIKTENFIGY